MIRRIGQTLSLLAGVALFGCGGATPEPTTSSSAPNTGGSGAAAEPATGGAPTDTAGSGGGDAAEGKSCGARAGDTCSEAEYCAYLPGQYCGAADAQAHCLPRPGACAEMYAPVCGCDGKTYGNACAANLAGQGINTEGECPK